MILVDTNIWIDFLRGNKTQETHFLENLLMEGQAALCEIIFCEICFGARDEAQWKKYSSYFGALPFLHLQTAWHTQASELGFKLKKSGFKPFVADLLIAMTALQNKVPLFTRDKDFLPYQKFFDLKIITGKVD